jgi:uncharacterized repeat protein (TIGR03943 family)
MATLQSAKSVVFLAFGGYLAYLTLTQQLSNYISARFTWLCVVAAVLFFGLGIHGALGLRSQSRRGNEHWHEWLHRTHEHTHPRVTLASLLVVGIPLVLGLLVPSRPLGASAVEGDLTPAGRGLDRITTTSASSTEWTVLDWLRLYHFGGNPERLNGREADLVGFIYKREGDPSGAFMVTRFLMNCCSADATAVALPVVWADAERLPVDTWVRVRGTVEIGKFGNSTMPIVRAQSVEQISQPREPYLYA